MHRVSPRRPPTAWLAALIATGAALGCLPDGDLSRHSDGTGATAGAAGSGGDGGVGGASGDGGVGGGSGGGGASGGGASGDAALDAGQSGGSGSNGSRDAMPEPADASGCDERDADGCTPP